MYASNQSSSCLEGDVTQAPVKLRVPLVDGAVLKGLTGNEMKRVDTDRVLACMT